MADAVKNILSAVATTSSRVSELTIKDAQLIFVRDKQRVALDWNGVRTFYERVTILQTDDERQALAEPIAEHFYFVIGTAVLWFYGTEWIPVTNPPQQYLFIGTKLPEFGSENTLYADKKKKQISVWDAETQSYIVISDYTNEITIDDIGDLFAGVE